MYQKEPELLKEMVDSKAGAGYAQDEPRTSCLLPALNPVSAIFLRSLPL